MKIKFKLTCLMAFVWLFAQTTMGQVTKITVMHNGTPAFFGNLTAAVAAAVAGDTVYLPGGGINPTTQVIINKKLTIVGAGHYPDSTTATNPTIVSSIALITGADNGSISGCTLNYIQFGTNTYNYTVNNYRIERCNIVSLYLTYGSSVSSSQGVIIRESVIEPSVSGEISTLLFEKNIFRAGFYYASPAIFNNNIFYCSYWLGIDNSILNNNIIVASSSGTISLGVNSVLNNNLFCTTAITGGYFTCGSTNVCNNNISGQTVENTFVNAITTNFSYSNNYHLLPSSPGKNAGTDGTDLGIYGTLYPYKEAAVPFNPHIGSKNIGTVVSPTGNLSVDIKVSAQDR